MYTLTTRRIDTPALAIVGGALALLAAGLYFFNPLHILAAIGFVAVLVFFAVYPHIGVYAVAFLLPVTGWHWQYREFLIPPVDALGIVLAIAFALRLLYLFLYRPLQWRTQTRLPFAGTYLIFLAATVAAAAAGLHPAGSLWYIVRWPALLYVVYIFIPYNTIHTRRQLQHVIAALCLSALAVALLSVASLTQQDAYNEFVRIQPMKVFGVYPIGDNHNTPAEIMVMGAWFMLALALMTAKSAYKTVLPVIGFALALVALGTFSRTAWIVLALQAVVFLFVMRRQLARFILPAFLTGIVVIPLGLYMFYLQTSIVGISATANRWTMMMISYDAFTNRPWLGFGSGTYMGIVEDNIRYIAQYGRVLDAHSVVQKIVVENGLVGLIAFSLVIIVLIRRYAYALGQTISPHYHLLVYLILGSGGILLFQLLSTSYYKGIVWLPVTVTMLAIRFYREDTL